MSARSSSPSHDGTGSITCMTGRSDSAYTGDERRHMWVWGAAAAVSLLLAGIAFFTGHSLVGVVLGGLSAGFASQFGLPWRTRRQSRLRESGLLTTHDGHGE
jgi:hypothetical protein